MFSGQHRRWSVLTLTCFTLLAGLVASTPSAQATPIYIESAGTTLYVVNSDTAASTLVGPYGFAGVLAQDFSPNGTLYAVVRGGNASLAQLATVNLQTGAATLIGSPAGVQVEAMAFTPDGTLYAVGDANPASPTFNTLYTVDQKTGAFTAVGSTGVPAPNFFMDLAFDARGTMYGASMFGLFTIDRKTGTATKVVDFVGGGAVMGLGYNAKQDKLYATDWKTPKSALYVVDTKNGFLTPMADIGYPLSHGLVAF